MVFGSYLEWTKWAMLLVICFLKSICLYDLVNDAGFIYKIKTDTFIVLSQYIEYIQDTANVKKINPIK